MDLHFLMALGRVDPRQSPRRLLHDGAGAQGLAAGQRRLVAARRRLAQHVAMPVAGARSRRRADRTHHQRRPRVVVAGAANAAAIRTAAGARLDRATGRGEPVWRSSTGIDDGELWETHQTLKARLLDFARRRAVFQAERRGESPEVDRAVAPGPEPGYADDRLRPAVSPRTSGPTCCCKTWSNSSSWSTTRRCRCNWCSPARPIRKDVPGKHVLQEIAALGRDSRFIGKVVFVEDYDINVARHLVQGVDVWLNNPRRPLEASGTSGMKVVLNGGLNLSMLDGWWAEAYDGRNGFAIGQGETHVSTDVHDSRDRDSLIEVLRNEVVPLYYDRDRDGVPRAGWRASSAPCARWAGDSAPTAWCATTC